MRFRSVTSERRGAPAARARSLQAYCKSGVQARRDHAVRARRLGGDGLVDVQVRSHMHRRCRYRPRRQQAEFRNRRFCMSWICFPLGPVARPGEEAVQDPRHLVVIGLVAEDELAHQLEVLAQLLLDNDGFCTSLPARSRPRGRRRSHRLSRGGSRRETRGYTSFRTARPRVSPQPASPAPLEACHTCTSSCASSVLSRSGGVA